MTYMYVSRENNVTYTPSYQRYKYTVVATCTCMYNMYVYVHCILNTPVAMRNRNTMVDIKLHIHVRTRTYYLAVQCTCTSMHEDASTEPLYMGKLLLSLRQFYHSSACTCMSSKLTVTLRATLSNSQRDQVGIQVNCADTNWSLTNVKELAVDTCMVGREGRREGGREGGREGSR